MLAFLSLCIIFLSFHSNIFAGPYNLRSSDDFQSSYFSNQQSISDYSTPISFNTNYDGMADPIIQLGMSSLRKERTFPSAELHHTPHSFDTKSPQSILECDEKSICLDLNPIVNIKSSEEIQKESEDAVVILIYRQQPHPEIQEDLAGQSYFNMESLKNPGIKRISVAQKLKKFDKKSQKTGNLTDNVASTPPSSHKNSSDIKPTCHSHISTIHSDPTRQPQKKEGLTDNANIPAFPSFEFFTDFDEQPLESIESTYNSTPPLSPTIPDFTDFNNFYQEIRSTDTSNSQPSTPFENSMNLDKSSADFEEPLPEAADPADSHDFHSSAIGNSSAPGTSSKKRKSFSFPPFSDHENSSHFCKKLKKSEDLTNNLDAAISSDHENSSDIESSYYSDSSTDFSDFDASSLKTINSSDDCDRQISSAIENSPDIRSIRDSDISTDLSDS